MWAKTYGISMDFLKTFSMEDFRKGRAYSEAKKGRTEIVSIKPITA